MTDDELIARLRVANAYKGPDFNTPIADPIKAAAADRIEALVDVRDTLRRLLAKQTARAERLETMLRQMLDDPEYWSPYARAALKGADHE